MIDSKKIEEAAKHHIEISFISEYWQAWYKYAFTDGAEWAIHEFLKEGGEQ